MSGYGIHYFYNRHGVMEIYKGSHVLGERQGSGTLLYHDGSRFEGTWTDNNNSVGTYYDTNKSEVPTQLQNGRFKIIGEF